MAMILPRAAHAPTRIMRIMKLGKGIGGLLAERGGHVIVGPAIARLARPARDQHLGRTAFGGIGVEALALLVALVLAELVGTCLAVRRAVRGEWTDHSARDHRRGLGKPRQ